PGDNERKLARALTANADVLLVDLEDSVSEVRKGAGRQTAADLLRQQHERRGDAAGSGVPTAPKFYVRINALSSAHWEDDLRSIVPCRPDGVMLPKSRDGDDVHRLSVLLGTLEETHEIAPGAIGILALATETASAIFNLPTYTGSSTRLVGLAWGAEDLSAEIGATATRLTGGGWTTPYRLVRDLTLLAATAADVAAIDSVYTDIPDLAGLQAEALAAARDGFSGKMALHPDQVSVINAAFTPSGEDVERARAIVQMFEAAPEAGVLALDGQMLDRPHLERARRLLARAGVTSEDVTITQEGGAT
ncbi:MAG: hypothetical protein RLZ98_1705, partial [Pseudomonadota bacterium]